MHVLQKSVQEELALRWPQKLILDAPLPCRGTTEIATERFFCGTCGSMLWGEDNRYPERIYPAASCLDTSIPGESHACRDPLILSLTGMHDSSETVMHGCREGHIIFFEAVRYLTPNVL